MKILIAVILLTAALHAADDLEVFPPACQGMRRFVINIPPQKHEQLLRVELLIGRNMMLDQGNRYFFGGALEKKSLAGWGYDYYELKELGPLAGTLMAVDPKLPKVERFITLGGDPQLLRYNSRLPLVIYLPQEADVRYRIWRGDQKTQEAASN
jgi:ecotin